jgi:sn1-specific diacylglycerol lipase
LHPLLQADDPLHKDLRTPLDFRSSSVCALYNRVVYYTEFAMAAYGWRLDTYKNGLRGVATSLGRICGGKKRRGSEFKASGDPLGWSTATLKHLTKLRDTDLLYASFVSEVFCPAFYVAVDHSQRVVVVAIRGSLSIKDALTDLSAQPSLLTMSDKGDYYGHKVGPRPPPLIWARS